MTVFIFIPIKFYLYFIFSPDYIHNEYPQRDLHKKTSFPIIFTTTCNFVKKLCVFCGFYIFLTTEFFYSLQYIAIHYSCIFFNHRVSQSSAQSNTEFYTHKVAESKRLSVLCEIHSESFAVILFNHEVAHFFFV